MGLTRELDATAKTLKCGVLASKLVALLDQPAGTPISHSDRQDIEEAIAFLEDLLNGAQTLSSGKSTAGVTAQAIKSLGFAFNPLEQLQRVCGKGAFSDKAIIEMLSDMQTALKDALKCASIAEPTAQLAMTKEFFAFVADSLLASLKRSRMSRPNGISF